MSQVVKFKVGDRIITKVRNWAVGKSKEKGTRFVRVNLDNYITWTGWVTKAALEHTLKALETMGFKGADLSMIQYPNALNCEVEVVAVIEELREYKGKTYYEASFINKVDEAGFKESKESDETIEFFKQIDTRAYITDAKDISGPAANDFNPGNQSASEDFANQQIPF